MNNEQIVRKHFENLWNANGDLETALNDCCTPDVELRVGDDSIQGFDGYRKARELFVKGFPDIRFTVDDLFSSEDGERVLLRWSGRGTHRGEFMGMQPTGKTMKYWGLSVYEIRDGKIAKQWGTADIYSLVAQLTGEAPPFSLKAA